MLSRYSGGIVKDEIVFKRFRGKIRFVNYLYERDNEMGEIREEFEVLGCALFER